MRVSNGSFETGHQGWNESTQNYNIQYDGLVTNQQIIKSRSGSYYVWFGGADAEISGINAISEISQTVTVPANAPYLRMYYLAKSNDFCIKSGANYWDYAQVLVNDVVLTKIELCKEKPVNKWTQLTFNLTAYKNQSVVITIQTTNDDSLISSFWVDDVGFVPKTKYVLNYYGNANDQPQSFSTTLPVRPTATP